MLLACCAKPEETETALAKPGMSTYDGLPGAAERSGTPPLPAETANVKASSPGTPEPRAAAPRSSTPPLQDRPAARAEEGVPPE